MDTPLFTSHVFPIEGSRKGACLIAGYRGKITSYRHVIQILNNAGYTVVAYEHSPAVLTTGDPALLRTLVTDLCIDFEAKAKGFNEIICTGASIGAGLCFAVQNHMPNVTCGIYAGAGVSPSETVFSAPLFRRVRRQLVSRGINATQLKKEWAGVDITPYAKFGTNPFIIALGTRDLVVSYDKALATLHAWQDTGQHIEIITKKTMGHIQVIRWYKKHFYELLAQTNRL